MHGKLSQPVSVKTIFPCQCFGNIFVVAMFYNSSIVKIYVLAGSSRDDKFKSKLILPKYRLIRGKASIQKAVKIMIVIQMQIIIFTLKT